MFVLKWSRKTINNAAIDLEQLCYSIVTFTGETTMTGIDPKKSHVSTNNASVIAYKEQSFVLNTTNKYIL